MCHLDLSLKPTQQSNEANKTKLAKWCPSAVATPADSLVGSECAVPVLHHKKCDYYIFGCFQNVWFD